MSMARRYVCLERISGRRRRVESRDMAASKFFVRPE